MSGRQKNKGGRPKGNAFKSDWSLLIQMHALVTAGCSRFGAAKMVAEYAEGYTSDKSSKAKRLDRLYKDNLSQIEAAVSVQDTALEISQKRSARPLLHELIRRMFPSPIRQEPNSELHGVLAGASSIQRLAARLFQSPAVKQKQPESILYDPHKGPLERQARQLRERFRRSAF